MLNSKNGGGSSMISTGIVGTPFQSYSPKSASRILVNTSASVGPPISRHPGAGRRPWRGRSIGTPAIFMREIGLDGRREVGGARLVEAQAAVGSCWRRFR